MTNTFVTRFDRELLEQVRVFVAGMDDDVIIRTTLEKFGLGEDDRTRGRYLVSETKKALEWEDAGTAWNFLSVDKEGRLREARHWYKDARRRYVRSCVRSAEEEAGWGGCGPALQWNPLKKLTVGFWIAIGHFLHIFSPKVFFGHRVEFRRKLRLAAGEKPEGAPLPKDTALVELSSWYERWRLIAQRVFRQAPHMLLKVGLKPGKAPPRLRTAEGRSQYGEGFYKSPEHPTGCDQMSSNPA